MGRVSENGRHQENKAFQTQWDSYISEPTEPVAAFTGSTQVEERWSRSIWRVSQTKSPALAQKLSPIGNHPKAKFMFLQNTFTGYTDHS